MYCVLEAVLLIIFTL